MEARNRSLPDWFTRIRTGQILLPRFQREEAWSHSEVSALLDSVLLELPVGAALILDIGDKGPFVSRKMVGAPEPVERTTEHLLDGQQRLTALWRSLNDDYPERSYFVKLRVTEEEEGDQPSLVYSVARGPRNGKRYPLWADTPEEQYTRALVPLRFLCPGNFDEEIGNWCDQATGDDRDAGRTLERRVNGLRQRVARFNMPFLSLPVTTPPEVAISVFIRLNTSSVPLTPFDIVVAQVEAKTGQSLRDLASHLRATTPELDSYVEPPDLILNASALREDRTPTNSSYFRMDLEKVVTEWETLEQGIANAISFLAEEMVFDRTRLPTVAVVPILSALMSDMPVLDELGKARTLLRSYLWRAFLTRRYEFAAGSKALQDYRGLRDALRGEADQSAIPIFDEDENPLPTVEEITDARWPRSRDILARGILAVSLRAGAHDLADGTPVSRSSIVSREYHHLFPDSLLTDDGRLPEWTSAKALNCAVITWKTNRHISAKDPIDYLRDRIDRAALGEQEIRHRLATHLVPFDELNAGGYDDIDDRECRAEKIQLDYNRFIGKRAEIVHQRVQALCRGEPWPGPLG